MGRDRTEKVALAKPTGRQTWPRRCRVAFSSSDWKIGFSSPGELEMILQHLGRRSLLLQRLAEIVSALAQLVEQPRVLDGDHGLGGEVLDQLDLLVGERADLLAEDRDRADQARYP